jgi:hypothetical protein
VKSLIQRPTRVNMSTFMFRSVNIPKVDGTFIQLFSYYRFGLGIVEEQVHLESFISSNAGL